MNIGEISKPTVDRAQVNKQIGKKATDPVTESYQILDVVELSDESKRRSQEQEEREFAKQNISKAQNKQRAVKTKTNKEQQQNKARTSVIDIKV